MLLKSWFTSSMIWFPLAVLSTILIFAYFLFQRTLWPCFCLQRTGTESSCHITGATWWSHLNRELQYANLRWSMEKNNVYSKCLCLPRTWQVWNKRSQIKKAECIVQISQNSVPNWGTAAFLLTKAFVTFAWIHKFHEQCFSTNERFKGFFSACINFIYLEKSFIVLRKWITCLFYIVK